MNLMRLLLRNGAICRSWADFEALLVQLREAGIPVAGGGHLGEDEVGEDEEAILVDQDSDADRAIAILAKLGVDARRG
jgi:hypothetical protein